MRRVLQLGLFLTLWCAQLFSAEMANLRNGFSIRHERHDAAGDITRLYLDSERNSSYVEVATAQIESFEPASAQPALPTAAAPTDRDLDGIISAASTSSRIDADFIASVIRAESANNPRAISPKGAQGLMQLMPATASRLGVKDSFNPVDNVGGGVRYLQELLVRYDGDAAKALAAYNAGPQRVQQYHGVPPYRETHAYVTRVISDYNRKKLAEAKQTKPVAERPRAASGHKTAMQQTVAGGK